MKDIKYDEVINMQDQADLKWNDIVDGYFIKDDVVTSYVANSIKNKSGTTQFGLFLLRLIAVPFGGFAVSGIMDNYKGNKWNIKYLTVTAAIFVINQLYNLFNSLEAQINERDANFKYFQYVDKALRSNVSYKISDEDYQNIGSIVSESISTALKNKKIKITSLKKADVAFVSTTMITAMLQTLRVIKAVKKAEHYNKEIFSKEHEEKLIQNLKRSFVDIVSKNLEIKYCCFAQINKISRDVFISAIVKNLEILKEDITQNIEKEDKITQKYISFTGENFKNVSFHDNENINEESVKKEDCKMFNELYKAALANNGNSGFNIFTFLKGTVLAPIYTLLSASALSVALQNPFKKPGSSNLYLFLTGCAAIAASLIFHYLYCFVTSKLESEVNLRKSLKSAIHGLDGRGLIKNKDGNYSLEDKVKNIEFISEMVNEEIKTTFNIDDSKISNKAMFLAYLGLSQSVLLDSNLNNFTFLADTKKAEALALEIACLIHSNINNLDSKYVLDEIKAIVDFSKANSKAPLAQFYNDIFSIVNSEKEAEILIK